jgi:nicotinate-nucleotide adenylyltransferase
MARLGVFGGSFDPPHVGHLILAESAREELRLDSVLWMPSPDPPHKTRADLTRYEIRREMALAAIKGNPFFVLNEIERERPGPYYTVDTLRLLQQQHPLDQMWLLIGEDSLRDLPLWHDSNAILAATPLATMHRPHAEADLMKLEQSLPGIIQRTTFLRAPAIDLSSSMIRARFHEGLSCRYLLPESVEIILRTRSLYR